MTEDNNADAILTSAPPAAEIVKQATTPLAAPLPPTEVLGWRAKLSRARSGGKLLDALIEPHDAARLVQSLPIDDLHGYIHRIGIRDADSVLALTSREQVRGLLDTDIWQRDTLSLERVDPWLKALMRAGHEVLVDRIQAVDDSLLNWLVRRSVRTIVVDDPESFDPPDYEHVMSPDGRLCIGFPDPGERDLPIKLLLDGLMRENPALCVNLLVHAEAALDSNLQEDAYRWRTARMADRGYVDYYEALAIYTAPRPDQVASARDTLPEDAPRVERWLVPVLAPAARLAEAFTALEPEALDLVQASLGYVANMALSADRIEAWDLDAQKETLDRLRAGLVLGIDALAGDGADVLRDAEVLGSVPLALIFRTGYARMIEAASPARKAASDGRLGVPGSRIGAVDMPALALWAEALTGRHPQTPSGPPKNREALDAMRAQAEIVAELGLLSDGGRKPEQGIGQWLVTWMTRDLIGLPGPGALPLDQLEPAHRALFAHKKLRPDARTAARSWWKRARGEHAGAFVALLAATEDAMGAVSPTDLEPRLLSLWDVAPPSGR